ncbi:hypothetical protein [Alteromonas halophila]|uniref:Sulfotransferase family protein n=1 Tax=Alteromonas halophila TaxID=516698 RepID=A0A918JNH7_9ALTE|nr:hypothetical protein [Alteromonas halophila]GGW92591.1 hypothetical protein GCM10007391_28720 [Alteromonas halophila]
MKSLIIHAGLHKTGSTSIQNFLGQYRKKLAAHGLTYPKFSYGKETFHNHSAPLRLAFSKQPGKLFYKNLADADPQEAAAHFHRQFEVLRNTETRILLSAEGFSQFTESELSAFLTFFEGWDIRVLLYVRPAYSYHCSAVQEQIKNGRSVSVAASLVSRSADIVKLQSVFSNIEFFHFPDACARSGPVGHFVEHLNLPLPKQSDARDNVGLSNVAVRIANHVNAVIPIRKNGKYNPQAATFNAKNYSLSDGPFRLTEQELDNIRDAVEKENAALTTLTGLNFSGETMKCSSHRKLTFKQQVTIISALQRTSPDIKVLIERFLIENAYISPQLAQNRLYTRMTATAFNVPGKVNRKWRAAVRRLKSSLRLGEPRN